MEESAAWYDSFYERSEVHRMPTDDFEFFPVWAHAASNAISAKHTRIVELGCGVGHFRFALHRAGWRGSYVGEDFSETAIARAQARGFPGRFLVQDITTAPPVLHAAAAVYAFAVLEHVTADFQVLQRFPEGTPICFCVPSDDAPGHVRVFANVADVEDRYAHLVQFTEIIPFHFSDGTDWLATGTLRGTSARTTPNYNPATETTS